MSEILIIMWVIRSLLHTDTTSHGRSQVPHTFLEWNDSGQQTSAELVRLSHWS